MHFKQAELKNILELNDMKIDIDEDQLKPEGAKHEPDTPRDSGKKRIDFERKDAHREKIQDNAQIRALVVKALGERQMLVGKKIVVKVDNNTVYILGELDNIQQNLQVKSVLALLKLNRRFSNKLTIKPAGRTCHYQQNLL